MNPIQELDRLLKEIHPSNNIERYERRRDRALNTFTDGDGFSLTFDDFADYIHRFYQHLKCCLFDFETTNPSVIKVNSDEMDRLLLHEFPPRGPLTAYQITQTGTDGGLLAVLRRIALRATQEIIDNAIGSRVHDFVKDLTFEEMRRIAREYGRRYGRLLPPDWTANDCALIAVYLKQVLKEHPLLLVRMRRINP